MNELLNCWLYVRAYRWEYYSYHGDVNRSEKNRSYENILWECYKDVCVEFYDKYVGRLVRTRNGDIGAICSIYPDIPSIVAEFDFGKHVCLIHDLELI